MTLASSDLAHLDDGDIAILDVLADALNDMSNHSYGERVNMLDHSLQSASRARRDGASDDLVLAALLHDVGHLLGEAGDWGFPGHAELGARYLARFMPSSIVEPIRLHVAAKRYLVATDPAYLERLSHASVMSLAEQGGPFDQAEAAAFASSNHADAACSLRRWDDDGKVEDLEVAQVDDHRTLLGETIRNHAMNLPATWVRDACRCTECRAAGNDQHLLDISHLDGWTAVDAAIGLQSTNVVLRHRDGQLHHCVVPREAFETIPAPPVERWGSTHAIRLHERAGAADKQLDHAIADLDRYGIALVTNVPREPGEVLRFAQRLGFVRVTNYGDMFDVVAEPEPINLAYTSVGLPLHTDNPYRNPCPTVQLLHCLESASEGGGSQFSDGFRAAELLRINHPAFFDLLTTTLVTFRFQDRDVDLQARRSLIEVDAHGEVRSVSVNHRSMEAPAPHEDVAAFYDAYRTFVDLLSSPEAVIEITLTPGDLIAFDNRRVLHGRAAFDTTARRHLQGCYIDIDSIRSSAAVGRR